MNNRIIIWRSTAEYGSDFERIPSPGGAESLNQATQRLPGGAYTTLRTFGRDKVLPLADHVTRLKETAVLAGKPVHLELERLRKLLQTALADAAWEQSRIRVILDLEQEPGALYVLLEELHVPDKADYQHGVRVVTRQMHRDNPKAKLTAFIQKSAAVQQITAPGVGEVLMVADDGRVLEGLSSNFFGIRAGTLYTADEGVLSGITRTLLLEVAAQQGVPVVLEGVHVNDLLELEEAFITSASRAVLPVTEIDGRPVGDGKPGAITQRLLRGYQDKVAAQLERI